MKKIILILTLALFVAATGCAQDTETTVSQNEIQHNYRMDEVDAYMASVKEQSDSIKYELHNAVLNQNQMNMKSMELYELWDELLNYLWGELKNTLPEDEFANLLDEQLIWIADKENEAKEAAKGFEGGSLYPFIVNGRSAALTEERVYELYEILNDSAV